MVDSVESLKLEKDNFEKEFSIQKQVLNDKICSLKSTLDNYEGMKTKVDDLKVCIEKFTNGWNNFAKLLGAQKHAFNKHCLGYNFTHHLLQNFKIISSKLHLFLCRMCVVLIVARMVIKPIDALL